MSAQNQQLSNLLTAFRRHSDLRRRSAPLTELAASRRDLHVAGMAAYRTIAHQPPR